MIKQIDKELKTGINLDKRVPVRGRKYAGSFYKRVQVDEFR